MKKYRHERHEKQEVDTEVLVAETQNTEALIDTSVEEQVPRSADTTHPNMDLSSILAAQDHFEAVKRGEANIPRDHADDAVRKLNQVTPELDWDLLQKKISESVPAGSVKFQDQKIVVQGRGSDEAKNLSARVWKVLGDLRKSNQIRSLPSVEVLITA